MVPMMPVISVPLDQVPCPSAGAGANQGTFPSSEQCASNQSCRSSDDCSFGPAVMRTPIVASGIAPLRTYIQTSKCPEYESHAKKRSQHPSVSNKSNHFNNPQIFTAHSGALVFRFMQFPCCFSATNHSDWSSTYFHFENTRLKTMTAHVVSS